MFQEVLSAAVWPEKSEFLSGYVGGLLGTVCSGYLLSALRLCLVITFFAILLKETMFALISVTVCLAFGLLD